MNTIELLAPAKDLECGMAAIDCGADAVYIGAPRFGARDAAGNSLEDLAELTAYAHKYWAKVYATVNTLLRDDEIPEALELIGRLHEIGIDGLIVQDTGLLECDLPPIPLIASTQMHNSTPERVAFLGKVGIQRAILARELELGEIREIRESTDIELEFFIHGALCVCYSGQCYLSCALGGRSGNRGQCAQPCRKLYSLFDSQGKALVRDKHLLSLRDLNLSDHIRELIEAGICSFKIEGRLKDRAYVSNVVAFYRARIDEALAALELEKSSSGASRVEFTPNVHKTFNRGFTTHFLHGRGEPVGSIDTPKMVGETIGRVATVGRNGITVETSAQMHAGDGICFFNGKGELQGSTVNGVQGHIVRLEKAGGIEPGTIIYRNRDHEFLTRLEKARTQRQIAVTLSLRESDNGLSLSAVDEDGNQAEFAIECEKAIAEKPEQALANIEKQLAKSGGTEFACSGVSIELQQPLFVQISTLNELRRGALEALAQTRAANRPVRTGGPITNDVPYPETRLTFTGNVLNGLADRFYRRHGVITIEPAAESGGVDLRGRRLMTTRYCIKHQLGLCPKVGKPGRMAEPLFLVDTEGHKLELRFDCAKCEMGVYLAASR